MWSREGVGVAPFRHTTGAFLLVKHSEDLMRWLDAITTARRRLSREDLVVVCLMLLAIAAQLHASLSVPSPLQQRDIFRYDVANYASVLVQTGSPDVFDGDLIYGDDGRLRLARANARVYMAGLERLHDRYRYLRHRLPGRIIPSGGQAERRCSHRGKYQPYPSNQHLRCVDSRSVREGPAAHRGACEKD